MQFTLSVGFCPADWYVPLARAAEAAGWDSIAVPDGLFYHEKTSTPYPYSADGRRFWAADTPFLDPWVVIATMAGATRNAWDLSFVSRIADRSAALWTPVNRLQHRWFRSATGRGHELFALAAKP